MFLLTQVCVLCGDSQLHFGPELGSTNHKGWSFSVAGTIHSFFFWIDMLIFWIDIGYYFSVFLNASPNFMTLIPILVMCT